VVPETGIESVRPLFTEAADFKKKHTDDSVNEYGSFQTPKNIEQQFVQRKKYRIS
jgi:hypothetical protein